METEVLILTSQNTRRQDEGFLLVFRRYFGVIDNEDLHGLAYSVRSFRPNCSCRAVASDGPLASAGGSGATGSPEAFSFSVSAGSGVQRRLKA